MNILGPDELVFGVKDVASCVQYLTDYGLMRAGASRAGASAAGAMAEGGLFEALDGTGVRVLAQSDASLPPALGTGSSLRETVYGVADEATVDAIERELRSDRVVVRLPDGSVRSHDDLGFSLRFRTTVRHPFEAPAELVNSPGAPPQRGVNRLGVQPRGDIRPRTLSHLVLFVPDPAKAEAFYVERLGFRCTDRFTGVGPFLRTGGSQEHHSLFLIRTPPHMQGIEHFAFHVGGPTEVMQAGTRFVAKGYQSFWGPGRHIFGSNWFWYFNSPLGCHVEYDADMDLHDDSWEARAADIGADTSQVFLFEQRELWTPGGPPPGGPQAKHGGSESASHAASVSTR